MKKLLPAAALLLTACQPNPDSEECGRAYTTYSIASLKKATSDLVGGLDSDATLKLAEMDAIEACGERGFLQKQAEIEGQAWSERVKSIEAQKEP